MHRILLTVSAACLLVASGAVHGIWTERWTSNPERPENRRRPVR